jgi:hypothetical protein
MDTYTLTCCLKFILKETDVKGFKVLARDQLSSLSLTSIPFAAIVNTDDSNQPGSHWIAFFFYRVNDTVLFDYFDSYQNPLEKYGITLPYSHGFSLYLNPFNQIKVQYVDCGVSHSCTTVRGKFVSQDLKKELPKISKITTKEFENSTSICSERNLKKPIYRKYRVAVPDMPINFKLCIYVVLALQFVSVSCLKTNEDIENDCRDCVEDGQSMFLKTIWFPLANPECLPSKCKSDQQIWRNCRANLQLIRLRGNQ